MYEQNLKNLAKANKDELRFTLGYLLGMETDDVRVNKYKVEGCRQAIMITLLFSICHQPCPFCCLHRYK